MSQYFHLYCQQKTEAGWITPPGSDEHGHLSDFKARSAVIERLFLGSEALLPLQEEWPPDFRDTELFARVIDGWEHGFRGWSLMGDLCVDDWATSFLYIARSVPAQFAHLFASGDQPFPMQEILDSGCPQFDTEWLEDTTIARDSCFEPRGGSGIDVIDRPIIQRSRGEHLPRVIEVSWKLSIVDFIGHWQTAAIQSVRGNAADTDLRVICFFDG
jgi:hypothetical protein